MKGTRPLTNDEIRTVRDCFDGAFQIRNRSFFMLGISVGYRVSEGLSLKVSDVWQNHKPVTDILFTKSIVKGGEVSRIVPVNYDGQQAIQEIIEWQQCQFHKITEHQPLFPSQKVECGIIKPLKRQAIHRILEKVFVSAGLNGKLASHTLRKTFAQRVHDKGNNIYLVKELLGHKKITTTEDYLSFNHKTAREVLEAISLYSEDNPCNPLEDYTEEQLITKIISLGYEVRKSQGNNE